MNRHEISAARTATLLVFAMNGTNFASWASRIPEVKEILGLTPGALGLVLLAVSAGSVLGLPASGRLNHHFGPRVIVLLGVASSVLGMLIAAFAVDAVASRSLLMVGLFFTGLGMGMWDVSMNLEGTAVERAEGRAIMPWFHAAFSGGTVVAALIGAGLSAAGVPVWLHLVCAQVIIAAVCVWQTMHFIPVAVGPETHEDGSLVRHRNAWFEPRTLLIGLVVLAAGFTEGTANDWLAVALVEGHHLPHWAGVLGLAVFLTAMTTGRMLGTGLLDRHGRVPVLRVLLALAAAGCALVVWGGVVGGFVGAVLWGLGASLGFPVGMSAAADDPARAAQRLSVVSTIGYMAFLGGPPLLGWLGDHVGVLHALLAVGVLLVIAFFLTPAMREPEGQVVRATTD